MTKKIPPLDTEDVLGHVEREKERWLKIIGDEDPYLDNMTIGIKEVIEAHFLLVSHFVNIGEGIGGIGPKDLNLLHSALSRQFLQFGGVPKWNNRIYLCASLMMGLIKNHPFHDANKRTAFLVSLLHLQKIGRTPKVAQEVYEDFTVDIAENNLDKYEMRANGDRKDPDRDVKIIAEFLRKSTREIDLKMKVITYNELSTLLSTWGMKLENPKANRIDLIRYADPKTLEELSKPYRVAHIGFHGWTKQVSRKDIHIVRSAAKLDVEHGYDAQAFFYGVQDPTALIKKYEEPLRRLAFR